MDFIFPSQTHNLHKMVAPCSLTTNHLPLILWCTLYCLVINMTQLLVPYLKATCSISLCLPNKWSNWYYDHLCFDISKIHLLCGVVMGLYVSATLYHQLITLPLQMILCRLGNMHLWYMHHLTTYLDGFYDQEKIPSKLWNMQNILQFWHVPCVTNLHQHIDVSHFNN
jgi:hypothetical protein